MPVMNFKLNEVDDQGNVVASKEYSTMKDASEALKISYGLARELYRHSDGIKQKKYLRPPLKKIYSKYRLNRIIPNIDGDIGLIPEPKIENNN